MARPERSPTELLARCVAALEVAKPRDIVGAKPMAAILDMSWRNLVDRYITPDPGFPIKTRGSQGWGFEFEVVKVLRHIAKRCKERIAAGERESARIAELSNISVPRADEGAPRSYAELRQGLLAHDQIRHEKLAQGEYVRAADVDAFLRGYHERVMRTVLGEGARQDPTGSWPSEVRDGFDQALRDMASDLQRSVDTYLEGLNGNHAPQPGGTARRSGSARGRKILRKPG